jgi:hypothetical protein
MPNFDSMTDGDILLSVKRHQHLVNAGIHELRKRADEDARAERGTNGVLPDDPEGPQGLSAL